jgi:serine/threonine-protein kinase PpkA
MHRILVVEDEEAIRKNLERLLTLEGFEVATAHNGQQALTAAQAAPPDIVVTDINMPVMDGFELLAALRAHPELERTVVIMLTAAEDRSHMRRGMQLGADDYITKPFKREELLESIAAQVQKMHRFDRHKNQAISHAVHHAVAQTEEQAQEQFRKRYDGPENLFHSASEFANPADFSSLSAYGYHPSRTSSGSATPAGTTLQATVMFADIRNFTTMAERLSAAELANLLGRYFELACRPVVAYGGTHLKMLGDGLLALFEDGPQNTVQPHAHSSHASRALSAAVGLRAAAQDFRQWVAHTYGARGLPEFNVGIGLHSGEVTLGQLGSHGAQEVTPLGDSVNIASRLQTASKELGWTVVASLDTARLAGSGIDKGREQVIHIRGREQTVSACEVLHYQASMDLQLGADSAAQAFESLAIESVAQENSQITARAAKGALKASLWNLQSGAFIAPKQRFKGYEVIRKLGEGGMSDVFLAYSGARKSEVVLKVLRTSLHNDADMMSRFIQEYAVLSTIDHHHIAKIYDQGFSDEYAYIAMEYLSGGSFKTEIAKRPPHARVIDLLRQITSALAAIHHLQLVYRDLKPDNLMFRASGELVLVDFGIVKNIRDDSNTLVHTGHGQIIGTPYYISPEQASGKEVTHRSDFYSLGIILYELLTGARPYRGDSLGELLSCHLHAPIPRLPPEHAAFQPLLDRMMHKTPEQRPADCAAVWRELEVLVFVKN